jgi:hypothetical protein
LVPEFTDFFLPFQRVAWTGPSTSCAEVIAMKARPPYFQEL